MKKAAYWIVIIVIGAMVYMNSSNLNKELDGFEPLKYEVEEPEREYEVGLMMKTLTNPFFVKMEEGAKIAAKAYDVELIVRTGTEETSTYQQIRIIEDFIDEKVDAIVVVPGDSVELVPVLKKAKMQGIKIVLVDNDLDDNLKIKHGLEEVPFIGVDNESGAYACADYVAKKASEKEKSPKGIIFTGIEGSKVAQNRRKGALEAFESRGVDIVAVESANWKIEEAREKTRKLLLENPGVDVIFASNDMMALGVLDALREMDRNDVQIGGYDGISNAVEEVKRGGISATVDQKPDEQGYTGVLTAVRLIRGEEVQLRTMLETRLITK